MAHYTKAAEVIEKYDDYINNLNDDLIITQYERQMDSIDLSEEKHKEEKENKKISDLGSGAILIRKILPDFVESLENELKKTNIKTKFLKTELNNKRILMPNEIAFISIKTIFNNLYNEDKTITSIAKEIINNLMIQMKDRILQVENPRWYHKIQETTKTQNIIMRSRMLQRSSKLLNSDAMKSIKLDRTEKTHAGFLLLNILINMGIIEKNSYRGNNKSGKLVQKEALIFNDKIKNDLDILEDQFKHNNITNLAMIIKPQPWTDLIGGGYLNNELVEGAEEYDFDILQSKIRRVSGWKELNRLKNNNMDEVYKSLNTIQETSWQINKKMLKIIEKIWNNDLQIGGIIKKDIITIPSDLNPDNYHTEAKFQTRLKEHRKECAIIHTKNARSLSERKTFQLKINISKEYSKHEELYFPHNLDFRGRVYPIPVLINPQGDDISKSLLMFKEGKPLGKSGLRWLKIHSANTYGEDKISFDDRVKWFDNNYEKIKSYVEDPFNNTEWENADYPFIFLSSCIDLVEAIQSGKPENYISYLSVALDGSCSGIQHYSRMLRDTEGGEGVNLIPQDKPNDIYGKVSNKLKENLEEIIKGNEKIKINDLNNQKSFAIQWLESDLINRKLTKRPVMTTPYGVKGFGMLNQVREFLKEIKVSEEFLTKDSVKFITNYIDLSIKEVVIARRTGMDFIQGTAREFLKINDELNWVTPLGFQVSQSYMKTKEKRIKTFFGTAVYRPSLKENTDKVDNSRHINGIAPNFIHSLDATHLMMCVNRMKSNSFSLIHDSFGVHARDTEEFHNIIREEFVKLYRVDRLKEFKNHMIKISKEDIELSELPEKGNLNLDDTLKSDYLFA